MNKFDDVIRDGDPSYAFVPPYRREEVQRRIRLIERHLAGRITGLEAGRELGITRSAFSRLVQAWRRDPSPSVVAGAGKPYADARRLTSEQRDVIAEAIARTPGEIVERAVEVAFAIAIDRGVAMPSWGAMTGHVGRGMTGTLPA